MEKKRDQMVEIKVFGFDLVGCRKTTEKSSVE